jgi:phosphatidylinositol glycan class K
MVPMDHACNARNPFPGTLFHDEAHSKNWLCEDIEIDYKAEDLTAESILNLLRGRYDDQLPKSRRLITGPNTRIFIYFNGHGGENFFKIQDTELIHSEDLAKVFREMYNKKMYKEVFFMLDTCEAFTMFDEIEAPEIYMLATAVIGESALADKTDGVLNTFLADKFSAEFNQFLT